MANTTSDKFNKDFAFRWQKEDNKKVHNWMEFASSMLTIPMAHMMATNYMILDGTHNKQTLKVMRPYQVYATQKVINKLRNTDFNLGINKLGYIWHTTGSGKTITSFKTAWLASRMPNIDKVVFLVDRIALTQQTNENYRAYDPDATDEDLGVIQDTKNVNDLSRKLKSNDNNIIVTSVQKLERLIKRPNYKVPDKNIVFIVDEAHRSTGGEAFKLLQKTFKKSAWIGYTGTPVFDNTTNGPDTKDIFGPQLHAYTIREAIADKNVLGFKVDFQTTISEEAMKKHYLPQFYKKQHPKWDEEQIQDKIKHLTLNDIDDEIEPSFYDENKKHVELVVKDIFDNWRNRSSDGKYNAILTTHVGGRRSSSPMAMMYYNEFQKRNEENLKNGKLTLKVAVTFSQNTSNNNTMVQKNKNLYEAIMSYNKEFGTNFGMDDIKGYTQEVMMRLNKTAEDGKYLDLVIVIDQLLTGFDAPELNTLYVDRTLKNAALIQAYSRTNRIANMTDKPWGRIINYRWPKENEELMNKALAKYSNKDADKLTKKQKEEQNIENGIIAKSYKQQVKEVKQTLDDIKAITNNLTQIPSSEKKRMQMRRLCNQYMRGIAKIKQYDPKKVDEEIREGFDYDNPESLYKDLKTTEEELNILTSLINELNESIAQDKNITIKEVELEMIHIKEVEINYDYIDELLNKILNQKNANDPEYKETLKELKKNINTIDNPQEAKRLKKSLKSIEEGVYNPDPDYSAHLTLDEKIQEAITALDHKNLDEFRKQWGIKNLTSTEQLEEIFKKYQYIWENIKNAGSMKQLWADVIKKDDNDKMYYQTHAEDKDIQKLPKMKYRRKLKEAFEEFTNKLKN